MISETGTERFYVPLMDANRELSELQHPTTKICGTEQRISSKRYLENNEAEASKMIKIHGRKGTFASSISMLFEKKWENDSG